MKRMIVIVRWVVGLLFIFSGLVKANDPLGLSYKMQEFFEVWGWQQLNDYTLAMSIIMNTFEIVAGIAIIIGWQRKLFTWLLLALIIFFTFLTGYALFSGKIKTCGCFGDCIPLKASQSFAKDIILLLLIVVLVLNMKKIYSAVNTKVAVGILLISTAAVVSLQFYVLKHLPLVDCLPYRKGNDLMEQMKMPANAIPDSVVIYFKYRKNGQVKEFDADHFPEDFDSTYEYIDRADKVVREGNARPAITDFNLQTLAGSDTTTAVFAQPDYFLLVIRNMGTASHWKQAAQQAIAAARQKALPVFIVAASPEGVQENFPGIPVLLCDGTVIKTIARTDAVLYRMNKALVKDKAAVKDAAIAGK
jgi:uncharacterized membrane protein YphA (DoxX/SURF4 family)